MRVIGGVSPKIIPSIFSFEKYVDRMPICLLAGKGNVVTLYGAQHRYSIPFSLNKSLLKICCSSE